MSDFSIVFMGTPEFAVTILDKIVQEGITVKAVVTAPDKPSGRGLKLNESAVKKYAIDNHLPILQPVKLKDPDFLSELKHLNADLFVVVAFRMLPEEVWNMPPKGTINLHASLLPQYRGAAPINWAIMNGENKTGVTTFLLDHQIDTGAIIDQEETPIDKNETVGELYERLMHLGAETVLTTLRKIESGNYLPIAQKEFNVGSLKHAPKIFREDCEIITSNTADVIHNHVRGLSPYPAAWMNWTSKKDHSKKNVKILRTLISELPSPPGSDIKSANGQLFIPSADFYVEILELQPEGKRKMTSKEFLVGNSASDYTILP